MTSWKNTLLRHGIHSELFLLAYVKPDTGYGLAKRLQDTIKKPDTSKTSVALKKLEENDYLIFKNKKYHPNIDRLAKELILFLKLKEITMDDSDKKFLETILAQNSFFIVLPLDVMTKILSQPDRIHHIDALEIICNHIGMMCTFYLRPRKNNQKIVTDYAKRKTPLQLSNEIEDSISEINKEANKFLKGSKATRKKKMATVNEINGHLKSLIIGSTIIEKTSTSTLKKLERLWDQHDGFEVGTTINDGSIDQLLGLK